MKTWGIGVIGCGSIADVHMKAIGEIENAKLVAVSSRREERAREVAQQYGCGWSTDYQELLNNPEIEIVCVTTGSGSHGKIGMDALRAGKHVLVEKPLAMTSAEAATMIGLAEEKGLVLSVVSQTRFVEHHRLVKRVIDEGKLGKLLLVEISRPFYRTQEYYDSADWRGTLAEDGGALMNQGIHSIDLLLWIGGKVKTVIGRVATQTHQMEAEDMGLALLTLENGAFATVMCSTSIVPGLPPSMHLYGEKGSIQIKGQDITLWTVPDVPLPEYTKDGSVGGGAKDPRNISSTYHKLQIIDFIEAVRDGRKPFVTGEEGKDTVRLIELIYESSAHGGMPIPYE
jgi:UDP-N-acetyl-2-amino-2-deoxyglucuronate dehydrogenase